MGLYQTHPHDRTISLTEKLLWNLQPPCAALFQSKPLALNDRTPELLHQPSPRAVLRQLQHIEACASHWIPIRVLAETSDLDDQIRRSDGGDAITAGDEA